VKSADHGSPLPFFLFSSFYGSDSSVIYTPLFPNWLSFSFPSFSGRGLTHLALLIPLAIPPTTLLLCDALLFQFGSTLPLFGFIFHPQSIPSFKSIKTVFKLPVVLCYWQSFVLRLPIGFPPFLFFFPHNPYNYPFVHNFPFVFSFRSVFLLFYNFSFMPLTSSHERPYAPYLLSSLRFGKLLFPPFPLSYPMGISFSHGKTVFFSIEKQFFSLFVPLSSRYAFKFGFDFFSSSLLRFLKHKPLHRP